MKQRLASTAFKIGKGIVWIYTQHLLTFAGGVIAGSVQTLFICRAMWL